MNERCSCGADLPPDARFCPRCGKPQREEDIAKENAAPAPPPALAHPVHVAARAISFHNGAAMRSALLASMIGLALLILLSALPLPPILQPLAFLIAGVMAVSLYRRRLNEDVALLSGARLGWIAGLFCFLTFLILFTISLIAISDPAVSAETRKIMAAQGIPASAIDQFFDALRNPASVLTAVLFFFLFFTALAAVGGAIGAWIGRSRNSPAG